MRWAGLGVGVHQGRGRQAALEAPGTQQPSLALQVYSLHWNQVRRDSFLSGSWDDTVKLWNLVGGRHPPP